MPEHEIKLIIVYGVNKPLNDVKQTETIETLKLAAMGIKIDRLTAEQKKYLASWESGT